MIQTQKSFQMEYCLSVTNLLHENVSLRNMRPSSKPACAKDKIVFNLQVNIVARIINSPLPHSIMTLSTIRGRRGE